METRLKDLLYEFEVGFIRLRIPTSIGDIFERRMWGGWGGRVLGKLAPLRKYLKERIWRIRLKPEDTFLKYFNSYRAIDMVALTHKTRRHKKERELMGDYFNYDVEEGALDKIWETLHELYYGGRRSHHKDSEKKRIEAENRFKRLVWDDHRENKAELFEALQRDYEIILFFTPLADLIGHIGFGSDPEMKKVYRELDSMVGHVSEKVKETGATIIGLSDHGMEQIVFKTENGRIKRTRYGDHSEVKQGTFFINKTVEEIKQKYKSLRNKTQEKRDPPINKAEQRDIENALKRLEDGNPTLRDFYHIIKIYGSR